jgi:hypothetical protein
LTRNHGPDTGLVGAASVLPAACVVETRLPAPPIGTSRVGGDGMPNEIARTVAMQQAMATHPVQRQANTGRDYRKFGSGNWELRIEK